MKFNTYKNKKNKDYQNENSFKQLVLNQILNEHDTRNFLSRSH